MNFFINLLKSAIKVSVNIWAGFFAFMVILIVLGVISAAGDSAEVKPESKTLSLEYQYGNFESKNKILSIPINGVILGDEGELGELGSLFETPNLTFGYKVKHQLEEAAENPSIKGVILEINSPGGTIYGSQAIADGVKLYKEKTGNPVVTFVAGLAASGGYWAAASTDHIVADYGTGIGSIGVITGPFKYYDGVVAEEAGLLTGGILTENGIQSYYVTAGESKDLGNPFRKMTDIELASLQSMVNNQYGLFVSHVAEHRSLSSEYVRSELKALLYDPIAAKDNKLIDDIGSREASYTYTAQKADLKKDGYQVVRPKSNKGFVDKLFAAASFMRAPQAQSPQSVTSVSCNQLGSLVLAYHGSMSSVCR
jgi:protease-4